MVFEVRASSSDVGVSRGFYTSVLNAQVRFLEFMPFDGNLARRTSEGFTDKQPQRRSYNRILSYERSQETWHSDKARLEPGA